MNRSSAQRHVLVTGASSGIGAAIAQIYLAEGHRVTMVARNIEKMNAVAAAFSDQASVIGCDLTDETKGLGWLADVVDQQGPVDVLINNAGLQVIGTTGELDIAQGERSILLNLVVPLRLIHHVLPTMRERGMGQITNIASMAALAPTPYMTYYNASKAGLAGASEALRGELKGTGINVTTVYPGIIASTQMAQQAIAKYARSRPLDMQPVGTTEELARRVLSAEERRTARVIYPRANTLARHFPAATRWLMDRFSPALTA